MPEFKKNDVEIKSIEKLYDGFFTTELYKLRHRLFEGGWSAWLDREVMDRGHAVVVLPYDPVTDQIVTLEQFRVGAIATSESPWLTELVAGMVDEGESAEDVAHRELDEEAGLKAQSLEYAMSYLSSPGGLTERIYIYIARVDAKSASQFGGLASENEDIKVEPMARADVLNMLDQGKIDNAATVIALQWMQLHINSLRQKWGLEPV